MTRSSLLPWRFPWLVACLAFSLAGLSLLAAERKRFDIPAGTADKALKEFIAQSGSELVYPAELARGVKSSAVIGDFTPPEALDKMLAGTGLVASQDPKNGALVVRRETPASPTKNVPSPVAQSAIASGSTVELDTFEVTGSRLSNRRAIAERQDNDSLVDAIGADELGNLPDLNLGEALGRIVGVTTIEDEGVGRYASVRGLKPEFVNVTMDGAGLSAAARPWDGDSARATNLQAISPDIISKVQVFKTVTPDLDGESIAGTINFKTRSAYDTGATHRSLDTSVGYVDGGSIPGFDQGLSWRASGIVSTTFGRGNRFGLVLNGSYRDIERLVTKRDIRFQWGLPAVPANPTGQWDSFTAERAIKHGGYVKFEYRPSASLYAFVAANFYDEKETWEKDEHMLYNAGSNASFNPATGSFTNFGAILQPRDVEFGTDGASTFSAGLDWKSRSGGRLSLLGSRSDSTFYLIDRRAQWLKNYGSLTGSYVTTDRNFDFTMSPASAAAFSDPAGYAFNEFRATDNTTGKLIQTLRVDWEQNVAPDSQGWGYKVGAKYSDFDIDFTESSFRGDRPANTGFNLSKYAADLSATSYVGTLDVPLIFTSLRGVQSDIAASGLAAYKNNFGRRRTDYANARDYQVAQDVYASYLMGRYASSRFSTAFGVRYEQTGFDGASRRDQRENAPFVKRDGSYDYWLPSINANLRLRDDLRLRAAYSETIGRPPAVNLVPLETTPDFNTGSSLWNVRRSNTDLKPRESDNYDLAVEYYFDRGNSVLSAGYFRKDITNEIYDVLTIGPASFVNPTTGETITSNAAVTQPRNVGTASMEGIELSLVVDRLRFLPAPFNLLGFSTNFTSLKGGMDLLGSNGAVRRTLDRLPQQSPRSYNLTLFYTGKKFGARLAARRNQGMIYTLSQDPLQDLVQEPITRFDLQASYRLNKQFECYVEIANLGQDATSYYGGPWDESQEFGRTFWLGLKSKF